MPVEVRVKAFGLKELALRIAAEADGVRLRLDLIRDLRAAVAPAVEQIKSGAQQIQRGSSNASRPTKKRPVADSEMSLGAAIARGVGTQIKLKGRTAGVAVRAKKSGMPRNFPNAPKRINQASFRHPVYKTGTWVEQVGKPGFFDDPLKKDHLAYRAACIRAMEDMSRRIAR